MSESFLVVDDHPLFREALQSAIRCSYPAASISEAPSIAMAHTFLSQGRKFDLVLLDLAMPGVMGFEGLLELRALDPKQPIVIISALEDDQIIHEAISCGAAGFICKSARRPELQEAIEAVLLGNVTTPKTYQPPREEPGRDARIATRLTSLTPQQLRVLRHQDHQHAGWYAPVLRTT